MPVSDESFETISKSEKKILFLGTSGVGKSSLVRSFVGENFLIKSAPSAGVDMKSRIIRLEEHDMEVRLVLMDAAGKQTFHTVVSSYFREADCYVIVFDVTDYQSFFDVQTWIDTMESKKQHTSDKPVYVIGNKSDLWKQKKVKDEDVKKFCSESEHKPPYYMTSCKTGEGVEDAFYDIAENLFIGADMKPRGNFISTLDLSRNPVDVTYYEGSKKPGCACSII